MKAKLICNSAFRKEAVDKRLFGSFVEHMGRVVYSGIYEPRHPQADANGFRNDVLALAQQMGISCVRYPGGNFVSTYDWQDGVGPREKRPKRAGLAWRSIETNEFGLNEFMRWAAEAGVEPILTVNLGTKGIENALNLLEYCNLPGGTYYSDLRKSHGAVQAHNVHIWCLGNEMDGIWQVGHKTADEYGSLAAQTGRAMKLLDPSIELVACGSSKSDMASYPDWDITVLNHVYGIADYLSIHQYYGGQEQGTEAFLAQSIDMERYIDAIRSAIKLTKLRKRSSKSMYISIDEWGVWERSAESVNHEINEAPWQIAPAISEQIYTMEDALLFASMLMTMLRNADIVKIGCQSLLTNISACIMTDAGGECWKQTIYYPFSLIAQYGQGTLLETVYDGSQYATAAFRNVPYLDTISVVNDGDGTLNVFVVNRSAEDQVQLDLDLQGFAQITPLDHIVLHSIDPKQTNAHNHDAIVPASHNDITNVNGAFSLTLEPLSFHVIRFSIQQTAF